MIVVYGTVCLDRVFKVPRLPELGGYVEISEAQLFLGGEAANTAVALAKWGDRPTLVGNPLGKGQDADFLAKKLLEHNLENAVFPSADHKAPVCHIFVTPEGERTMLGFGFIDMEHRGDPSLVPTESGGWITADSNHGEQSRVAIHRAHSAGMHAYLLDFVRDDEKVPTGCWWQSSTSWAGSRGQRKNNLEWIARFSERNDCNAILTDGANGFYFSRPGKKAVHLPAFPIAPNIDSTGAGDVFRAGMLHGLSRNWQTSECLKFASAAAALNCLGLGATGGLETSDRIADFIAEFPEVSSQYQQAE